MRYRYTVVGTWADTAFPWAVIDNLHLNVPVPESFQYRTRREARNVARYLNEDQAVRQIAVGYLVGQMVGTTVVPLSNVITRAETTAHRAQMEQDGQDISHIGTYAVVEL